MRGFREEIELHQATEVRATATSAMRVTRNGPRFVRDILELTASSVEVIGGEREAELIAKGIRQAVPLGAEKHLLMDIGGGSVEFIIANADTIFLKHSFEIRAQRLLDQFFPDPSGVFPSRAAAWPSWSFSAEQLPAHGRRGRVLGRWPAWWAAPAASTPWLTCA
ncbi:MAG: hypothetical protein WKG07_43615 [Hymenobacter sp.]